MTYGFLKMRQQLRTVLLRVTVLMMALLSSPVSESGNMFSLQELKDLRINGVPVSHGDTPDEVEFPKDLMFSIGEKADSLAIRGRELQLPKYESDLDNAYRRYVVSIFADKFEIDMESDFFRGEYETKDEFIQSMKKKLLANPYESWEDVYNASDSQVEEEIEEGVYLSPFGQQSIWIPYTGMKATKNCQGWKIHISAKPHSAQKIAEMVLPILADLKPKHLVDRKFSRFKIARTLPHLRRLNALKFFRGFESQSGKFLVIYPENAEHRIALAKAIDEMFCQAKRAGTLNDDDFVPIIGDAIVGESGWVYTRYGKFSGDFKEEFVDGTFGENIMDNRFFPWPDFMNTREEWRYAPAPFGDLNFQWVSQSGQIVTWTEGTYYGAVGKPQGGWSALQEGQDEDDD